jgi:Fe-S cluster assembly scaffold protein SufB
MATKKIDESQVFRITSHTDHYFELQRQKPIKLGIVMELVNTQTVYKLHLQANEPNCIAEVKIISVLRNAHAKITAILKVAKGSKNTNLNLSHQTILLDNHSTVITEPKLQLSETDIKCGHGATVSVISEEMLEYLTSRGITRQNAETMLYMSQINQVCEWVLTK